MYKLTLTLQNSPKYESLIIPTLEVGLKSFTQWLGYYSEIKQRIGIKGNYQLTLSTIHREIVKTEAI